MTFSKLFETIAELVGLPILGAVIAGLFSLAISSENTVGYFWGGAFVGFVYMFLVIAMGTKDSSIAHVFAVAVVTFIFVVALDRLDPTLPIVIMLLLAAVGIFLGEFIYRCIKCLGKL